MLCVSHDIGCVATLTIILHIHACIAFIAYIAIIVFTSSTLYSTQNYTKIHRTDIYISSVPIRFDGVIYGVPCFQLVLTVCKCLRFLSNMLPLTVEIADFNLIIYKVESYEKMDKGLISI